jgi:hypothetical protein
MRTLVGSEPEPIALWRCLLQRALFDVQTSKATRQNNTLWLLHFVTCNYKGGRQRIVL